MCRIAGYLGPVVPLSQVLTDPPHSLRTQAREPRELPPGMLGADGYGYAWLAEGRRGIARYRQTLAVWSDPNLDAMVPHIASSCFVASTRTASEAMPVSLTNTPPFVQGGVMLVHNGEVVDFHVGVSEMMRADLEPSTRRTLQGNTETEYLAAALRDESHGDLAQRVRALIKRAEGWLESARTTASLNLIVADGRDLIATRHAIGQPFPSLYFAALPNGGTAVASEPLSDVESWTRLPERALLRVSAAGRSREISEL